MRPPVAVLAGGVLLQAINIYLTASLMPSIVKDLGGERFFAWAATAYMVACVVAAMLVSRLLAKLGSAAAYGIAIGGFLVGSVVCAIAPDIAVLLVGRALQGLGAGLLGGLAFAVISFVLPDHLWARGSAVISAMFGIGTLAGPAIGGAFGQLNSWRLAFVVMAVVSAIVLVVALRALDNDGRSAHTQPIPLLSLVLLTAGTGALSLASVATANRPMVIGLIVAALLIVAFFGVERRATSSVLPRATYAANSPLKWTYLAIGLLTITVVTEGFVPWFGQQSIGMAPLAAGFFGAAVSVGWSLVGLFSVKATRPAATRAMRVFGPVVATVGLVSAAAIQWIPASLGQVIATGLSLVVAGSGIGMAFPHHSVAAMRMSSDPQEAAQAAAGIPVASLVAQVVGMALGGLLVNEGLPSVAAAGRNLFGSIAILTTLGILAAVRATRSAAPRPEPVSSPVLAGAVRDAE